MKQYQYTNTISLVRWEFIVEQVRRFADGRKLRILDIGCGNGEVDHMLGREGHFVLGVDRSAVAIAECRKNNSYPGSVIFIEGDAHDLLHSEFNVVICSEVLEHTRHPEDVIAKIGQNLVDRGMAVITVPNGYCLSEIAICRILSLGGRSTWMVQAIRAVTKLVSADRYPAPFCLDSLHVNFFTLGAVMKLFEYYELETIQNMNLGIPYLAFGKLSKLKRWDCALAQRLPHAMAGGWMMVLKKK